MSRNSPWQIKEFDQKPSGPSGVQMFDPSKFQNVAPMPNDIARNGIDDATDANAATNNNPAWNNPSVDAQKVGAQNMYDYNHGAYNYDGQYTNAWGQGYNDTNAQQYVNTEQTYGQPDHNQFTQLAQQQQQYNSGYMNPYDGQYNGPQYNGAQYNGSQYNEPQQFYDPTSQQYIHHGDEQQWQPDPNQGYYDPNQQYGDLNQWQGQSDPNQQWQGQQTGQLQHTDQSQSQLSHIDQQPQQFQQLLGRNSPHIDPHIRMFSPVIDRTTPASQHSPSSSTTGSTTYDPNLHSGNNTPVYNYNVDRHIGQQHTESPHNMYNSDPHSFANGGQYPIPNNEQYNTNSSISGQNVPISGVGGQYNIPPGSQYNAPNSEQYNVLSGEHHKPQLFDKTLEQNNEDFYDQQGSVESFFGHDDDSNEVSLSSSDNTSNETTNTSSETESVSVSEPLQSISLDNTVDDAASLDSSSETSNIPDEIGLLSQSNETNIQIQPSSNNALIAESNIRQSDSSQSRVSDNTYSQNYDTQPHLHSQMSPHVHDYTKSPHPTQYNHSPNFTNPNVTPVSPQHFNQMPNFTTGNPNTAVVPPSQSPNFFRPNNTASLHNDYTQSPTYTNQNTAVSPHLHNYNETNQSPHFNGPNTMPFMPLVNQIPLPNEHFSPTPNDYKTSPQPPPPMLFSPNHSNSPDTNIENKVKPPENLIQKPKATSPEQIQSSQTPPFDSSHSLASDTSDLYMKPDTQFSPNLQTDITSNIPQQFPQGHGDFHKMSPYQQDDPHPKILSEPQHNAEAQGQAEQKLQNQGQFSPNTNFQPQSQKHISSPGQHGNPLLHNQGQPSANTIQQELLQSTAGQFNHQQTFPPTDLQQGQLAQSHATNSLATLRDDDQQSSEHQQHDQQFSQYPSQTDHATHPEHEQPVVSSPTNDESLPQPPHPHNPVPTHLPIDNQQNPESSTGHAVNIFSSPITPRENSAFHAPEKPTTDPERHQSQNPTSENPADIHSRHPMPGPPSDVHTDVGRTRPQESPVNPPMARRPPDIHSDHGQPHESPPKSQAYKHPQEAMSIPKSTAPLVQDHAPLQHVEEMRRAHNSTPTTTLWEQPQLSLMNTLVLAPVDTFDSSSRQTEDPLKTAHPDGTIKNPTMSASQPQKQQSQVSLRTQQSETFQKQIQHSSPVQQTMSPNPQVPSFQPDSHNSPIQHEQISRLSQQQTPIQRQSTTPQPPPFQQSSTQQPPPIQQLQSPRPQQPSLQEDSQSQPQQPSRPHQHSQQPPIQEKQPPIQQTQSPAPQQPPFQQLSSQPPQPPPIQQPESPRPQQPSLQEDSRSQEPSRQQQQSKQPSIQQPQSPAPQSPPFQQPSQPPQPPPMQQQQQRSQQNQQPPLQQQPPIQQQQQSPAPQQPPFQQPSQPPPMQQPLSPRSQQSQFQQQQQPPPTQQPIQQQQSPPPPPPTQQQHTQEHQETEQQQAQQKKYQPNPPQPTAPQSPSMVESRSNETTSQPRELFPDIPSTPTSRYTHQHQSTQPSNESIHSNPQTIPVIPQENQQVTDNPHQSDSQGIRRPSGNRLPHPDSQTDARTMEMTHPGVQDKHSYPDISAEKQPRGTTSYDPVTYDTRSGEPRRNEPRMTTDRRSVDSPATDPRLTNPRTADPRQTVSTQADPRQTDLGNQDSRIADSQLADPRTNNPSATTDARITDPRTNNPSATSDPRITDQRTNNPSATSDPRITDPRTNNPSATSDPRITDPRTNNLSATSDPRITDPRIHDPRTSDFKSESRTTASDSYTTSSALTSDTKTTDSRSTDPRSYDWRTSSTDQQTDPRSAQQSDPRSAQQTDPRSAQQTDPRYARRQSSSYNYDQSGYYQDYYNRDAYGRPYDPYRPPSRADSIHDEYRKDNYDPYRRDAYAGYRSRGYSVDEYYDRPRSTQDQNRPQSRNANDPNRPQSVAGQEVTRPRSRAGSEAERPASRSGYEDTRNGQYGYSRQYSRDYYDQYYNQDYYQRQRYNRGYLEEMGYYKQQYGDSYPAQPPTDHEMDRRGSVSGSNSRSTTPGFEFEDQSNRDASFARDFHKTGSRPSSRQGYEQSPIYPVVSRESRLHDRDTQTKDSRYQDTQSQYTQPQYSQSQDSRYQDQTKDSRYQDQTKDPRYQDPRYQDPRYQDPRYQDPRYQDPRYKDYYSGYGQYDYSAYYSAYYGQQQKEPQQAVAVPKFSLPHMAIQFTSRGHMIAVLPNRPKDGQTAGVEVHEIETLLLECGEVEELKSFPGPLIRGETHKNDVLVFCQTKARECQEDITSVDRESAQLIWRYLELLIKQNGTVVGTDVADLLLQGHEPTSCDLKAGGLTIDTTNDALDDNDATCNTTFDRSIVGSKNSIDTVTDRFRHLLLYGRKKDSLEWAMKNNLWGHALFLASKMDTRAHANVMIRFANSSMHINDPLQTLYQLMSGRQPAAVTGISDEKWGDWRPHLAMILSNISERQDINKKSIVTLGDTLASRGCLHASHFCYLVANVSMATFTQKSAKWVLIGSNHSASLMDFASNSAIQCTEVYEYALNLANVNATLPNFQAYKFLYATRLAEYGYTAEALHYCEVISSVIQHSPGSYGKTLVSQLYQLSDRLKFCDPERQQGAYTDQDPPWLTQLGAISLGLNDGTIEPAPIAGGVTPLDPLTTTSSESGETPAMTSSDTSLAQYMTGRQSADYSGQQQLQQQQLMQQQQQGFQAYQDYTQGVQDYSQQYQQQQTGQDQSQPDYEQATPTAADYTDYGAQVANQTGYVYAQAGDGTVNQIYDPTQAANQGYYGEQPPQIDPGMASTAAAYDATTQQTGYYAGGYQQPQDAPVTTQEVTNESTAAAEGFDYFGTTQQPPFLRRTTRMSLTSQSSLSPTQSNTNTPTNCHQQFQIPPPKHRQSSENTNTSSPKSSLSRNISNDNFNLQSFNLSSTINSKLYATDTLSKTYPQRKNSNENTDNHSISRKYSTDKFNVNSPVRKIASESFNIHSTDCRYSTDNTDNSVYPKNPKLYSDTRPPLYHNSSNDNFNVQSPVRKNSNDAFPYRSRNNSHENSTLIQSRKNSNETISYQRHNNNSHENSTFVQSRKNSNETLPYQRRNNHSYENSTCVQSRKNSNETISYQRRNNNSYGNSTPVQSRKNSNETSSYQRSRNNSHENSTCVQSRKNSNETFHPQSRKNSNETIPHPQPHKNSNETLNYPQNRKNSNETLSYQLSQKNLNETPSYLQSRKNSNETYPQPHTNSNENFRYPQTRKNSNESFPYPQTRKNSNENFPYPPFPHLQPLKNSAESAKTTSPPRRDSTVIDTDVIGHDLVASSLSLVHKTGSQAFTGKVVPTRRRRNTSGSSGNSVGSVKAAPPQKPKPTENPPKDTPDKKSTDNGNNKGFLGGLFSGFSFRRKNEMNLPDDKHPKIIWDDARKRWVNTDGEDEPETVSAPPPKDADLSHLTPTPGHAPGHAPLMADTASPRSNRFQRQNIRGAKGRYVDVLNKENKQPSTAGIVPPSLFNVMPSVTPQVIFTPGAPLQEQSNTTQPQHTTAPQLTTAPQNLQTPSDVATIPSHLNIDQLSRWSSHSSLGREVQNITSQAPGRQALPPEVTHAPVQVPPIHPSTGQHPLSHAPSSYAPAGHAPTSNVPTGQPPTSYSTGQPPISHAPTGQPPMSRAPISNAPTGNAPSQPLLFDPSQFTPSASTQNTPSQGMRYGQRRQYPK